MTWIRAVHFAATITVAGAVLFAALIAEPAFRISNAAAPARSDFRRALAWIAWPGLIATVASGAAWLVAVAQSMSGAPLPDVFPQGVLGIVLLRTSFGHDWLARFALACVLGVLLFPLLSANDNKPLWFCAVVTAAAAALAGTLTWAGHAAGAPGTEGLIHPPADFLHLVAAAAWVGTLLPLVVLLAATGADAASLALAHTVTVRFSALGIASVATLLITGSINTWYLAGSVRALTDTDYGRLLLLKVALFLAMVAVAAVNRFLLTPRLAQTADAAARQAALHQLRRNAGVEIAIGTLVIVIVAVLGTTAPGLFVNLPAAHHSH